MPAFAAFLVRPLAAIGRLGAKGIALSLVAGLAVPVVGGWLKPFLPLLVGLFVTLGFARMDVARVRAAAKRPAAFLLALAWLVVSMPAAMWLALTLIGRANIDPGLVLGLSLQAAAAPILATPAVAIILGLEPTLALLLLTAHMAILPLVAPLLAAFVAGDAVPLDGWAIARNLALLIAGASAAAALIRARFSLADIRRAQAPIDGLNVIFFFLFAMAIMDGVAARALAEPGLVAMHVAIAFALSLGGLAAGFLALRPVIGAGDAFVAGYATGHRNAGLMIAAMGGALPDTTWLYFACVQAPIYFVPWMIAPLAGRLLRDR
ncbi:MAG: sodium:proton symporter [Rhizobiales bacterium]|nr:sodium:proton symporter [Hyphomicrobiales bacterium]